MPRDDRWAAFQEIGLSENRLMRLTSARGKGLEAQIIRAVRMLAQKGQVPVNLRTLFALIGNDPDKAEDARIRIAKDYYAAEARSEEGLRVTTDTTKPTTPKFIQIHFLAAWPGALLNRDDAGLAKRLPFGNATRTRISSQCLKRHWRVADDRHALHTLAKQSGVEGLRSKIAIEREVTGRCAPASTKRRSMRSNSRS